MAPEPPRVEASSPPPTMTGTALPLVVASDGVMARVVSDNDLAVPPPASLDFSPVVVPPPPLLLQPRFRSGSLGDSGAAPAPAPSPDSRSSSSGGSSSGSSDNNNNGGGAPSSSSQSPSEEGGSKAMGQDHSDDGSGRGTNTSMASASGCDSLELLSGGKVEAHRGTFDSHSAFA
jgi:hypothetical protein